MFFVQQQQTEQAQCHTTEAYLLLLQHGRRGTTIKAKSALHYVYLGSCRVPVADLAEGTGGPGIPLILGEKEEMTEGRKAGWASKTEPGPLLSSKSGSANGSCSCTKI